MKLALSLILYNFEIMYPKSRQSLSVLHPKLRVSKGMFCRFLSLQFRLGDAFLKSSKDFIH